MASAGRRSRSICRACRRRRSRPLSAGLRWSLRSTTASQSASKLLTSSDGAAWTPLDLPAGVSQPQPGGAIGLVAVKSETRSDGSQVNRRRLFERRHRLARAYAAGRRVERLGRDASRERQVRRDRHCRSGGRREEAADLGGRGDLADRDRARYRGWIRWPSWGRASWRFRWSRTRPCPPSGNRPTARPGSGSRSWTATP